MYDIIIVGGGPAGLFAADRLIREGLNVLILDERGKIGGSAINDGKLNLTHKIGMDIGELGIRIEHAQILIDSIDSRLLELGADNTVYGEDTSGIQRWVERAASYGVELIPARQRHLGTDNAARIWKGFGQDLRDKGVEFLQKRVIDIEKNDGTFSIVCEDQAYRSSYLIVAPGRGGSYWFREQARKLGVETRYGPVDVGIRVEVPNDVYDPITSVLYDPKLVFTTKCHGDRVRTFCTNPHGFVKIEPRENAVPYNGRKAFSVNGDAYRNRQSDNTNFALLHTIQLTEPDEDTTELGRNSIAECYLRGGGKPLVQRYGDLVRGKRSRLSTFCDALMGYRLEPTLAVPEKATPGDISLAYNGRTMDNLREALILLDSILPGVAHPQTLLYAPEVKFYDTKYQTTDGLETTVPKLFVAGDGCGKSRGIIGAALTGILAAEGILRRPA